MQLRSRECAPLAVVSLTRFLSTTWTCIGPSLCPSPMQADNELTVILALTIGSPCRPSKQRYSRRRRKILVSTIKLICLRDESKEKVASPVYLGLDTRFRSRQPLEIRVRVDEFGSCNLGKKRSITAVVS